MPHGAIRYPFGKCRICKDKATGVHYGVATCEGCKGFFKRSTTKGDKYKCFFGGQCEITPQNRNRCKSCRYRLCLESGMSLEAVKMGRIPKLEKEKALELTNNTNSYLPDDFSRPSAQLPMSETNELLNTQKHSSGFFIKEENIPTEGQYHKYDPKEQNSKISMSEPNFFPNVGERHEDNLSIGGTQFSTLTAHQISMSSDSSNSMLHNARLSDTFQFHPFSFPSGNLHVETAQTEKVTCLSPVEETSVKLANISWGNSSNFSFNQVLSDVNAKRTNASSSKSFQLNDSVENPSEHDSNHTQRFQQRQVSVESTCSPKRNSNGMEGVDECSDSSASSSILTNSVSSPCQSVSNDGDKKKANDYSESVDVIRKHFTVFDIMQFEESAVFNRLPLYIQTLEHLDRLQQTGQLQRLQKDPAHMIDRICAMLDSNSDNSKRAVDQHGEDMGKDSTTIINTTLQRLKPALTQFFKPLWVLRQYVRRFLNKQIDVAFSGDSEEDLQNVWPQLMKSVEFFNEIIIGFSVACPGFKNLNTDLKDYLLERAYFSIWILCSADFVINGKNHFVLPNGKFYSNKTMLKILKERTCRDIYHVLGKINAEELCDLEIGLLCIIQLTDPDDPILISKKLDLQSLQALHSHYLDILATIVSKIHPTNSNRKLISIFCLLPLVRRLSSRLNSQITSYGTDTIPEEDTLQNIALNAEMIEREKEYNGNI